MMLKYRISKIENILGKEFYCIESKRNLLSKWRYESHCLQEKIEEIIALKELLEIGGSQFSMYKPSEELKISKEWLRNKGLTHFNQR